jgi:hypothetical protein
MSTLLAKGWVLLNGASTCANKAGSFKGTIQSTLTPLVPHIENAFAGYLTQLIDLRRQYVQVRFFFKAQRVIDDYTPQVHTIDGTPP